MEAHELGELVLELANRRERHRAARLGLGRRAPHLVPAGQTSERLPLGDFYILCPDNEVDRATDERRIAWAAGDIIENRPPLSRWHPGWKARFEAFLKS